MSKYKFVGENPLHHPELIRELRRERLQAPDLEEELTRLCRAIREGKRGESNFFTGQAILIQAELMLESISSNDHRSMFVLVEKGVTVILTDIDVQ